MKNSILVLFLSAVFMTFVALVPGRAALADADDDSHQYVKLLGYNFEYQLQALEHLTRTEGPYEENAVRHAMGIVSTADLLIDTVLKLTKGNETGDWPWKDKASLEKMIEQNWRAANYLSRATKLWREGGDRELVVRAIKELRISCSHCHDGRSSWD